MLKILVVDDEPIIRKGIRHIIDWNQYGFEICGEAADGPAAVESILTIKPDLILLDLHLPGFSGIEVIKRIRALRGTGGVFIILSGYTDFEYAKEAINLGARGYIEKPIEESLLIERITGIAQELKKAIPEEQPEEAEREFRHIQFFKIMEDIWEQEPRRPFRFGGEYVQGAAITGEFGTATTGDAARNMVKFFPENYGHVFSYKEYVMILFEDTPELTVKRLLERFYDYHSRSNRNPKPASRETAPARQILITLGSRCRENPNAPGAGIRRTCREAENLMETAFFYRDKKYLQTGDLKNLEPVIPETEQDTQEKSLELSAYIQIIDHKKIGRFFSSLEAGYIRSGKAPREIRRECMTLIIETRNNLLEKFPALREMLGTGRDILDAIMALRYLGDIMDKMAESCRNMSECLPLLSADNSFQRIVSYVKNNYNADLRLETLGSLFNYNRAYLGKRFKEHTGKSFHTYLDILRIDAAKEMLRATSMKVYEISEEVGYANTDYFYSKFKKYTGESPLVFRRGKNTPS